jgi:U3 small nucleolar RNA-associated protein 14
VHRKERERLEQQERQALLEAGVDFEEEDREMNERRRAEARMGAKHKDSKWAKSLKQTGRTAWDEDARRGAAEQALKEEELRRRIEGKSVSRADEDYLGSSSSESEDEDPWAEDAGSDAEKQKLRKKLEGLEGDEVDASEITGPHAKLFSMKFMQNADAARKAQNDAEIRRLNRELRGEEESQSEPESEVGRRKFGQSQDDKSGKDKKQKSLPKNEFEEAPGSDDEADAAGDQGVDIVVNQSDKKKSSEGSGKTQAARPSGGVPEQKETTAEEENPWLVQTKRNNRRATADDSQQTIDVTLGTETVEAPKKQKNQSTIGSKKGQAEDDDGSDDEESVPVLLKNHDLVKRAFAGDEVVQEFEQDKLETIEEEGDKVIDETLPGWGSWTGEGVSKREQRRQKKVLTKVEGVKPENRKDAKLSRVIINEKRIRKVSDSCFHSCTSD